MKPSSAMKRSARASANAQNFKFRPAHVAVPESGVIGRSSV